MTKLKKTRNRFGADRQALVKRVEELANLSSGKRTNGYLTKTQLTELVVFLTEMRERATNG